MCSERRDDDVVGEPLGGDAAAVVAHQRDRHAARGGAPRASASITFGELPLVESASSTSPGAAVGDDLAREDRVGADVVGDRGEDRRVLGEVERRAAAARRAAARGSRPRRPSRRSPSRRCRGRAAVPPPSSAARSSRRARPAAPRRPRRASARAARRPPRPSSAPSAARRRRPPRGRAPARRGTDRGSSTRPRRGPAARRGPRAARGARRTRARAPTARGRASRRAPGRRTGRRSAARTPTRRRHPREGDGQAAALARDGQRRRSRPVAEGDRDVLGLGDHVEPAPRGRRPRRPGRAPAARACPRSPGGRTRPPRGARRSARPAWRPKATSRPPRAKRSAIRWHRRAMRSASGAKKRSLASVRSREQRPRRAGTEPRRAAHARGPHPRRRRRPSQSRKASTPSPVRALIEHPLHARVHRVEVGEEAVEVEVEVREQVDLVDQHELAGAEHQRVLERLVLALGDRGDHHPRVLADAELGRADEVADVLDHEQVDVRRAAARAAPSAPCSRRGGTRRRTRVGVELRDRHVQQRQPVGVEAALHVALQHARAHAASPRPSSARSSSVVLPAPGALIRLTTVTPARSKSARLARAIVLLASRTSSTTLTFVRCMRDPLHRPDLQ